MGKRSTKKRGRGNKDRTRRYRFRGGADCTQALETCNSLLRKVDPLAAEVKKLHAQLMKNAEETTPALEPGAETTDDEPETEGTVGNGEATQRPADDEAEEPVTEGTIGATADRDGDPEVTPDLQKNEEPDRQKKEDEKKTDEGKGEGTGGGSSGGWLEGFFAGGGRRKRRGHGKTRAIRRPIKRKSRRRK